MGRLVPNHTPFEKSDSNNISFTFALIILVIIFGFIFGVYKGTQSQKIKQAETIRLLNDCECAKHKERDVIAVSGILSGHIETKTVVVCKNGRIFTNLTDSQYFNIKNCED